MKSAAIIILFAVLFAVQSLRLDSLQRRIHSVAELSRAQATNLLLQGEAWLTLKTTIDLKTSPDAVLQAWSQALSNRGVYPTIKTNVNERPQSL